MLSPTPSSVLILGASGRLGNAAVEAFADAGWQVLAQLRSAPNAVPAGVRVLRAAPDDIETIVEHATGVRTVVYAINPQYTRWTAEALPLARSAMEVALRLGATFMLPGNVYNFGESMPTLLREDTPQVPTTVKGRIRCDLEGELERRSLHGLRSVVLRAGDFFGSGHGTWLDLAITKSIAKGRLVYPGPLDLPHAWAYLPDLARAFVAVAQLDGLPAFTRLHFAGHTLTGEALLAGLQRACAQLGLAPARGFRVGTMPWGLIRAGGLLVPMWREIAEMAYLWRVPHSLDGGALAALTGGLSTTSLDVALVAALRAQGVGAETSKAGPAAAARPG